MLFLGYRIVTYETIVKDALARLGFGTFRVALDMSHFDHRISVWALNQVILRAVAIPSGKALIRGVHAQSLVPESPVYSLGLGYGAGHLVDGDPGSLAYPGSVHLDYVIQLNGIYQASGISIDWNDFGTQAQYVNSWQVLGRNGNQPWQPLAKGGGSRECQRLTFP